MFNRIGGCFVQGKTEEIGWKRKKCSFSPEGRRGKSVHSISQDGKIRSDRRKFPLPRSQNSVTTESKFRYYGVKIPLLRSQNSVTARAKFRYCGSKLPLVRKNDSFARPGPLPPGNVVPQRVAPSLALPCEIFPKKTAPPACGSGESSYLCTRFPEGGLARRRPRRSGKKKFRVAGKKFGGSGGNAYLCSPFPPGAGDPREGRKFRSRGLEKSDL